MTDTKRVRGERRVMSRKKNPPEISLPRGRKDRLCALHVQAPSAYSRKVTVGGVKSQGRGLKAGQSQA